MAPGAVPDPLPAFTKTFWAMDPYPPAVWQDDLQYRGSVGPMTSTHWHRFMLSWAPSGSVELADVAYCHFDIAKVTGGSIDPSWAQADFDAVNAAMAAFVGSLRPVWSLGWTYTGHKAYRKGFNTYEAAGLPEYAKDGDPKTVWAPFADMGAPIRTVTASITGQGGGYMPPQVACALTFHNVKRRGWGRTYLPGITGTVLDAQGGLDDATLTTVATAAQTLINALATAKLLLVTPTTTNQVAGQAKGQTTKAFGLLTPHKVQVDSTLDVQRRRRHHVTRKVTSLP